MKIKKATKAFQLDPMPEPVTIVLNKKTGIWHPIDKSDTSETFIYGEGHVKIGKWKREVIQPLSNPYTAKDIADKISTIFELVKKMNLTFPRKDAKVGA